MEMLGELLGKGFVKQARRTVQPEGRSGLRWATVWCVRGGQH